MFVFPVCLNISVFHIVKNSLGNMYFVSDINCFKL